MFHAFPSWLKGGFIGVDVFFVISGYLISTIIFESLDKGVFSFSEFYARRIKRIFPALILVLIVCFAFGWFALLADEYKQLGKHIAAGAGFVSNLMLWSESGYFDNAADTKPLLHLWSLGIEEQFYIVWPLLMWLTWKRNFNLITITALVAIASFILNLKGVSQDLVATFYSPQTRFWELLSGSLLAWCTLYRQSFSANLAKKANQCLCILLDREKQDANSQTLANLLSFVGLMLLSYGFWQINKDLIYPGKLALVPVVGTILLLAGPKAWINHTLLSNKILVGIGLISYPLYLWHWPLLSFARIVESGAPTLAIRILAVVLSILLAWLTYLVIERPIRFGKIGKKSAVSILVLLMLGVGGAGYYVYEKDGLGNRARMKKINDKFAQDLANFKYDAFLDWRFETCFLDVNQSYKDFGSCKSTPLNSTNSILIWGDSYAAHLYPGLKSRYGEDVIIEQLTASKCPPILGIKLPGNPNCKEVNTHIFKTIRAKLPITIILSAQWTNYDLTQLESSILELKKTGANLYIIGSVPQWNKNLPKLLLESYENGISQVAPYRMNSPLNEYAFEIESKLKRMAKNLGINYVSAQEILCNKEGCITRFGQDSSTLMSADTGHLTAASSKYLVNKFPDFFR